jgi:signal transduction histidine kinase
MVSGLRGYLLTGENYFIQAYDSAAMENTNILNEISPLISSNPDQQKAFREILKLNERWISEFADPLINAKKAAGTSDSSLLSFNRLYRQKLVSGNEQTINRALQIRFRDFSNYEYELREIREHALTESISQTRKISFYLTTLSIGIGLAVAIFLAYKISSRILRMVKMADSIAEGNYEVSTEDTGKDELSLLARALNRMAKVLSENINLLKRKNQELDQFAHIVSHDLKAPLRGIDNVVTWIEEDHNNELSPKMQEYLLLIKGRLIRAENLIKGILSYARVGREMPEREPVDLNALMDEIKENIPLHSGLVLNIQRGLPIILTERIPLQQVLSNLLSNAVKYHDKQQGKIKMYMHDKRDVYEFFVEDNGPGIAKHYHDKIFMIFQTLNERDSFESTGVGLAIVKKILDDRKQIIQVKSEPGKGSVFSFTWPK